MKTRFKRLKTNILCVLAIAVTLVIIITNVLDMSFIVADPVTGIITSGDPITNDAALSTIPDVDVYKFRPMTSWTRDHNVCANIDKKIYHGDFYRVPLESQVGSLSVFIHDPHKDGKSKTIYSERKYEPNLLNIILLFLRMDENTSFIDIGANIGLLSLQVAKYGRRVLAIEPVLENVQHICASAMYGKFQEKVTIISDAVGKDHSISQMIIGRQGDYSGNYLNVSGIYELKAKTEGKKFYKTSSIPTPIFTLDDMVKWEEGKHFKKSFIKIDVEGAEADVLQGAEKFLENFIVKGIIMEWTWNKGRQSADTIVAIMKKYKFHPFDFTNTKLTRKKLFSQGIDVTSLFEKLSFENTSDWPYRLLWIPILSS